MMLLQACRVTACLLFHFHHCLTMSGNNNAASLSHCLICGQTDHDSNLHVVTALVGKRSTAAVRQELVEYIQMTSNMHPVLSSALDVSDLLEQYLSKLSQDGTWGDGDILSAANRLYRYPVHVLTEMSLATAMLAWTRVAQ